MWKQLSCCQSNVEEKAGGLNNPEAHANTVSNQKALARELFDAMVNKTKRSDCRPRRAGASISKQNPSVDSGIPVRAGPVNLAERYEKEEGDADKFEAENPAFVNGLGCCEVAAPPQEWEEGKDISHDGGSNELFAQARAGRPVISSIAGIGKEVRGRMADGRTIEGESITWPNGDKYEGKIHKNKRHGGGIFHYACGDKYEGEYRHDCRHGAGKFIWFDGNVYDGDWREDRRQGLGTFIFHDGKRYSGQYTDDKRHGRGTFTTPEGDKYEGNFRDGDHDGHGVFQSAHGWTFQGEFTSNRPTVGELFDKKGRTWDVTYAKNCAILYNNPTPETKKECFF
jgi:hypothetical protein